LSLLLICKFSAELQDPEALNVMLDLGLAFGTSEHPTTRLCLQWLQHAVRPGDQILDYGTGSGILLIAALKVMP
jgi:ribosomal protein L11 methyltransferase